MFTVTDGAGKLESDLGFVPLNIILNEETFSETKDDLSGEVKVQAKLVPSNKPNYEVSKNYYLALNITENNFVYSLGEDKPEILMKVYKKESPAGEYTEVTTLPDGTGQVTVTNGKNHQVSGFDITTKIGLVNIANPIAISASTNENGDITEQVDDWKVEVIFVNYNGEQNANAGKEFKSRLVIGKDPILNPKEDNVGKATMLEVNMPTNLSTGEAVVRYEYGIKESTNMVSQTSTIKTNKKVEYLDNYTLKNESIKRLAINGEGYDAEETENNTYTFKNLTPNIKYDIKVIGKVGNKTEILLDTSKETKVTLAEHIMNLSLQNKKGGAGLYHHDVDLENGAKDGNYRYAGANPDNYVCLGTEAECIVSDTNPSIDEDKLYRIIGVFKDNDTKQYQIKLIKKDPLKNANGEINNMAWNPRNNKYADGEDSENYNKWEWKDYGTGKATLNAYLNDKPDGFYQQLSPDLKNKITNHKWQIGGMQYNNVGKTVPEIYKAELGSGVPNEKYVLSSDTKIGLVYISDYLYAAPKDKWTLHGNNYDSVNDDWIFIKGTHQWTISRQSDESYLMLFIPSNGYLSNYPAEFTIAVRPTFYLESDVMISGGEGTLDNPFILG